MQFYVIVITVEISKQIFASICNSKNRIIGTDETHSQLYKWKGEQKILLRDSRGASLRYKSMFDEVFMPKPSFEIFFQRWPNRYCQEVKSLLRYDN